MDAGKDADGGQPSDKGQQDGGDTIVTDKGGDPGQPTDDGGPDTTPPCLLNAFSPGAGVITAHFSEAMDPTTAGDVSHYTVRSSTGDTISLTSANVNGVYVQLQVASGTTFDPQQSYLLLAQNVTDLAGNTIASNCNRADNIRRTLFLNLIWHQHQPLYVDTSKDQLLSPWVRKHSTKDYYGMAAMLADFPKVHLNVNLTSVLLTQLITFYLDRLGPFVDIANDRVDAAGLEAAWGGHTDPWIDLLLLPTPMPDTVSEVQLGLLHKDAWSCVSTSDVMMQHFPEYRTLRDKPRTTYTQDDFLNLKGWFEIAWFDPDFLRSAVVLPNGWVVDLSDVLEEHADGTFWLKQPITEDLCNRLVAEEYKIMFNVIPIHRQLIYNPGDKTGQIEVLTTPFYHPILPLLHDTNLALGKMGPTDTLPSPPFQYPRDAFAQVAKAVRFYQNTFGIQPSGMWPGEGSVAQQVVNDFVNNGIAWIATDQQILADSSPSGMQHWYAYQVNDGLGPLAIVFRDTGLSNAIGFKYQGMTPDQSSASFMSDVLAQGPSLGEPDRLLTVIMDGENAWENYAKDMDGKGFLHDLYTSLEQSYDAGEVISVTGSEFLSGNPARNVPPHPVAQLTKINQLSAGSWIDGNFAIWIGEPEENTAWGCLLHARQDVERSGLPFYNPTADPPEDKNSDEYQIYMTWEEMYAAEGSDWFWWFGDDMTTPANDDTPFDRGFRAHLSGVYSFMRKINPGIPEFVCPVIVQESGKSPIGPFTTPPTIDGKFIPNEAEWINEGGFFNDSDSGAVANPNDHIARVYYGYDASAVYVALAMNIDLRTRIGSDYKVEVYFNHKHIVDAVQGTVQMDPANGTTRNGTPLVFKAGGKPNGGQTPGAARVVAYDFTGAQPLANIFKADGNGGWTAQGLGGAQVAGAGQATDGKIVEMRIPYADLNLASGDPLEIVAVASQTGSDVDLAPNQGSQVIFEDATNVVKVVFEVDVSGTQVARDMYGTCCNTAPPPDGNGIAYIAGNKPALGAQGDKWIPNVISLRDDGQQGDATASDRKWTLIVDAQRNDVLKYKYTIGLPSDQGNWNGTEEFPVTFRGFTVVGTDQSKKLVKMIVHDVFADKPTGGRDGFPGSMTTFEYVYE